mmetsp:Transcript_19224/g.41653  ORF Transcript_19224/g.41653 Transcript_19224/m.41653 type:complete len:225 (-) Transcript_19224:504-1178(-)
MPSTSSSTTTSATSTSMLPSSLVSTIPFTWCITALSTSTATSLITAMSTSSTTASLLTILPHKNSPSLQFRIVQLINRLLCTIGCGKFNNTTSLGTTIVHGHHLGIHHIPRSAHVILEILPCHLVSKVADIDALAPLSSTARCFRTSASASTATSRVRRSTLLLPILPHKNLPPHQLGIIQSLHGSVGLFDSFVLNDSTSFTAAIVARQDIGAKDGASRGHVLL